MLGALALQFPTADLFGWDNQTSSRQHMLLMLILWLE